MAGDLRRLFGIGAGLTIDEFALLARRHATTGPAAESGERAEREL